MKLLPFLLFLLLRRDELKVILSALKALIDAYDSDAQPFQRYTALDAAKARQVYEKLRARL